MSSSRKRCATRVPAKRMERRFPARWRRERYFSPLLTDMLAVGEESGDMSAALMHIAKRYDDDLDRSVKFSRPCWSP